MGRYTADNLIYKTDIFTSLERADIDAAVKTGVNDVVFMRLLEYIERADATEYSYISARDRVTAEALASKMTIWLADHSTLDRNDVFDIFIDRASTGPVYGADSLGALYTAHLSNLARVNVIDTDSISIPLAAGAL